MKQIRYREDADETDFFFLTHRDIDYLTPKKGVSLTYIHIAMC